MADLSRQDFPPKAGPKWWIERVKPGQDQLFTCFSSTIFGVWTHWTLYGSSPCFSTPEACQGCKDKAPRRWKGYLHVYDWVNKRQCFLEITPVVAESIISQLGENVPFRGYRLKLKRGNGPKARVKVEVLAPLPSGPTLVEERSPKETLEKLWSLNGPDDFQENEGLSV